LPVITSRLNGAAELLTEGVEGYVISDPANVDELLVRLEPTFDCSVRNEMGRAARRLALEHTLERNVSEVLSVYEEVISRRDAGGRGGMLAAAKPFAVRRTAASSSRAARGRRTASTRSSDRR
jgi:UDP-glucose:(heptosyl)LPS alpha-1,3-glucosyltransferase